MIQSFLVGGFNVGSYLKRYVSPEAGIWWLRTFPRFFEHQSNSNTIEHVIEYESGLLSFKIHVWRPKKAVDELPGVLMFHGGGWMIGDIPMHRRYYSNIADYLNVVVVSPEYTLSPADRPMPSFADCYATAEYVTANAADLGISRDQIVISGDSAGGQLTIAVGMELAKNKIEIKGLVPLYPMTQIMTVNTISMLTETKYAISRV